MTDSDLAALKTLIEQAVTEATTALAPLPARTAKSPTVATLPESRFWALVNVADIRGVFVDAALRKLGGTTFVVAVDAEKATITATTAVPAEASPAVPQPAPHVEPATVPHV